MRETSDISFIAGVGPDFGGAQPAEFTLGALLADPLTRALMRADGVDAGAFGRMLRDVAGRLRTSQAPAKAQPSFAGYLPPASLDRRSDATTAIAGKAARLVCGSPCSW